MISFIGHTGKGVVVVGVVGAVVDVVVGLKVGEEVAVVVDVVVGLGVGVVVIVVVHLVVCEVKGCYGYSWCSCCGSCAYTVTHLSFFVLRSGWTI